MITSIANPHIKEIRKLAESKERSSKGVFLAEGLRVVGQAFDSEANIRELIVSEELLISEYGQNLLLTARKHPNSSIEITYVSPEVFVSIARKDKPQGIAAVIAQQWSELEAFSNLRQGILVALESVQNPGNLGTILRTCDAVGAKGLVLLDQSTDPYDPAAVKASMGSIFTVPVVRANYEDLTAFLDNHPSIRSIGTSDKAALDCFEANYPDPVLLLMGSEREGLSEKYQRLCEQMVSIPMLGACDSLNLSIATGVVLYQIFNFHRSKP